jgi:hypothetical protein
MAFLFLVGVPLALFVIIAALTVLPSLVRGPRYRPGAKWDFDPVWFGGVSARNSGEQAPVPTTSLATTKPSEEVGGASARW